MNFTTKHLEELKSKNLIRGFVDRKPGKPKQEPRGRIVVKAFRKNGPKAWIEFNLVVYCQERGLRLEEEYRFDEVRRFRFDWCIPDKMIAIEYEGGIHDGNSGHTSFRGINRDIEKYNLANSQGWQIIRLTAINYKTLLQALKKYEK